MEPSPNSYQETLDYLFSRLPMFSRIGSAAIKKDLHNTRALCTVLGNPQDKFRSIHIAGTNGKGSTSHMIAAMLQSQGYKTGLYTSPHLIDFRERIRINGQPVSEAFVIDFTNNHKQHVERIAPSFFEITVAMAFAAFAEAQVDFAVIETGLGGRLDSTNVITPMLSVITNIAYDHMDMLGNTLPEIAAEKAGIIKPGIPAVIGQRQDETARTFSEAALINGAPLHYSDMFWKIARRSSDADAQHLTGLRHADNMLYRIDTDLQGSYQQYNLQTALAAIEILQQQGITLIMEQCIDALSEVKHLTGLRGRWEVLQQRPFVVCDVGHNEAGLREILPQWQKVAAKKKYVLTGFVRDKDVAGVVRILPKDAHYIVTQAAIPRALPAAELAVFFKDAGLSHEAHDSVAHACSTAMAKLTKEDALLITGSFFIVGEALEWLNR